MKMLDVILKPFAHKHIKKTIRLILIFIVYTSSVFGKDDTETIKINTNFTETMEKKSPEVFDNLGQNLKDIFTGTNLLFHVGMIGSTFIFVEYNVDYSVQQYFDKHQEIGKYFTPVLFTGLFTSVISGSSLYVYGKFYDNNEVLGAGLAVFQAFFITTVYQSTLKAITGRPAADPYSSVDMEEQSKTFYFGFLRGGVDFGWPSGHTAVTASTVVALTHYYPDKIWLKVLGYSLVLYTAIGVTAIDRGSYHWFSEATSGILIGYVIGATVGSSFRELIDKNYKKNEPRLDILPLLDNNFYGLQIQYTY